MFNFDYITKEDIKKYNLNWPENLYHPYRIFIVAASRSEPDINKISMYGKISIANYQINC